MAKPAPRGGARGVHVLAFGAFDVGLHPGHLAYLEQARALGTRLTVVVARDDTVGRTKGARPILRERDRLRVVRAVRAVDAAVLGNPARRPGDFVRIVEEMRPDVIALGHDHWAGEAWLRGELARRGLNPKIVRLRGHTPSVFKTRVLVQKLVARRRLQQRQRKAKRKRRKRKWERSWPS